MHVTTKEIDDQGAHILTSLLEGDGAVALASEEAELDAEVISLQRTASGGIQVQTAVFVKEPAPPAPAAPPAPEPSAEEKAAAYLQSKGLSADEAKAGVQKFGVAAILKKQNEENAAELDALVRPSEPAEPKA